ncbi:hypothetical protein BRADI_4g18298v3 [Brachypodium distachyon]|uniref:Uncharacterized protein n=1 Tax=Brachypodium distachyon TaxID=15368 RepID=A0A2K2CNI9_BRADI|nr:hypothetical protein BRADI_4g18298v3 [Brachypodium distachyon]
MEWSCSPTAPSPPPLPYPRHANHLALSASAADARPCHLCSAHNYDKASSGGYIEEARSLSAGKANGKQEKLTISRCNTFGQFYGFCGSRTAWFHSNNLKMDLSAVCSEHSAVV